MELLISNKLPDISTSREALRGWRGQAGQATGAGWYHIWRTSNGDHLNKTNRQADAVVFAGANIVSSLPVPRLIGGGRGNVCNHGSVDLMGSRLLSVLFLSTPARPERESGQKQKEPACQPASLPSQVQPWLASNMPWTVITAQYSTRCHPYGIRTDAYNRQDWRASPGSGRDPTRTSSAFRQINKPLKDHEGRGRALTGAERRCATCSSSAVRRSPCGVRGRVLT